MAKGSSYEREICKLLSNWWSPGRDDIFWRSSQSGGRATQRMKKGKSTFGSYGDIAAVDPIGAPLLKAFTIELKRGRSHGDPGDLLDFKNDNEKHAFAKTILQAVRSAEHAKSISWLIISRRDHRQSVVFFASRFASELIREPPEFCFRYRMKIDGLRIDLMGMRLDDFLKDVPPKGVLKMLERSVSG